MSDYWLGVLTPFALIGGLALALAVSYALIRLGDWLRSVTHNALIVNIRIRKNMPNWSGGERNPQHYDQATKLRDALLKSPRMLMIRAFGRMVLIVREYREIDREAH